MLNYRVLIHYHNQDRDYLTYDLWQWQEGEWGQNAPFSELDYFGIQGMVVYETTKPMDHAYVIVKKSDWSSQSSDYKIELLPPHLVTEVWLVDGDDQVYYSHRAAQTSRFHHYRVPHAFDMASHAADFDRKWAYSGKLGLTYSSQESRFDLWAPIAHQVSLVLYENASNQGKVYKELSLERGRIFSENQEKNTAGVWSLTVSGDLAGLAYQYRVSFAHESYLTRDPYSIALSPDGKRSAIVDLTRTNPKGFVAESPAPWRLSNPCQAVICEMHVRDLTMSASSGLPEKLRGTFLGACQSGTKNAAGQATGFDYLKELGVNYVQLQPISDRHKDYDANGRVLYNWGYDPQNYNAPETSFSSDWSKPEQVIKDLKTMIAAYHEAGMGVILDVVYNHIYSTFDSPFQMTVPDYYYRMNANGSFQNGTGVGSETASEHIMFRKYMVDSLLYWVKEYGVDGFRFDLMGIHDVETMRIIREELDKIDPRILTYGEGWDMGTGLQPQDKAKKDNAYQLPGIGFFNDDERDAIKGAEVYGSLKAGFVSGQGTESILAKAILGSSELGSYQSPSQVLNYVEAHDNYNLHDLLLELHPEDQPEIRRKRIELATAMNLLMQGMAFMELGQEFSRTKLVATGPNGEITPADQERAMNSYNAPDRVNQVDWDILEANQESIRFIQQVIALKKTAPEFAYDNYEDIYRHVYIHAAEDNSGLLLYEITDQNHYLVVFNAGTETVALPIDDHHRLVTSNNPAASQGLVPPLTAAVYEID